ncbi:MAG: hypothetical protein H7Y00_10170, partial [Fimbriimonadaceae bacterium]|nr:hypothetical protein [Chitinophagales bacterium]
MLNIREPILTSVGCFIIGVFSSISAFTQATVIGTDVVSGTYTEYSLNDVGIFRQGRFQATTNAAANVRKWIFPETFGDYDPAWRPYSGSCNGYTDVSIAAYNQTIPPSTGSFPSITASATYTTFGGGAGCDGFLPAVTANNYYTFNISENYDGTPPSDEYMSVLETTYNPVTITSITQNPLPGSIQSDNSVTVTINTSATPGAGEYFYVRYASTYNFAASTILNISMSGTTGTAEIPCRPANDSVYYYIYSSNRTKATIDAEVTALGVNGKVAHDMSTLNLNNNAGVNYKYKVGSTTDFCGSYNVPSSCYLTISSFVTALNAGTVSCAVTCYVAAGHSETAPTGGINLTQTGTASNTITFIKNGAGANPIIYAQVGSITLSTAIPPITPDGIFSLNGSDYITIDGIDLLDNNSTTPQTMEYGYALFKASATDGCQNNTIKNCSITLKANNISSGPSQFEDGSRGIFSGNVVRTNVGSALVISSTNGRNDNNTFYGNTIKNVHHGIIIRGYYDISSPYTYYDQGNVIGISGSNNTIENFGSGSSASVYGIYVIYQNNHQISYNSIDNDASGGSSATSTLYGIFNGSNISTSTNTLTISHNTISLSQSSTSSGFYGITSGSFSGHIASNVNINYNTIQNCTNVGTTSSTFRAIQQIFNASTVTISHNIIQNNSINSSAATGILDVALIYNSNTTPNNTVTYNQLLNNSKVSTYIAAGTPGTAAFYGYYNVNSSIASGTEDISNNKIDGLTMSGTGAASTVGIRSTTTTNQIRTIQYDTVNNVNGLNGSVYTSGILVNYMPSTSSVSYNFVSNISSPINTLGINCCSDISVSSSSNLSFTCSGNTVSDISTSGVYSVYGIALNTSTSGSNIICSNNSVDDLSSSFTSSGLASINGIRLGRGNSGVTHTISGNVISKLSHTGTGSSAGVNSTGIYSLGRGTVNIYKNHIYNISGYATGDNSDGIYAASGSGATYNIYNNYIQKLTLSSAQNGLVIRGIYCDSASTFNVSYNTIALGYDGTIINPGVAGVLYSAVTSFVLRNNIIYVRSLPGPISGVSSCVRRLDLSFIPPAAIVVPPNFSNSSNNNFYWINSDADNYVYVEGIVTTGSGVVNGYAYSGATTSVTRNLNNDPCFNVEGTDITSYKYFMSPGAITRELGSYYDGIPFAGGVSLPQNLKLTSGSLNYAESYAVSVGSISTDWEGDIRQGFAGYTGTGTAPDVGADEDEFIALIPSCDLILPLELALLTGDHDPILKVNELYWQTVNETNSKKFEIERSLSGIDFEFIAEVEAAGNSTAILNYYFTDDAPVFGNNYYRLKMIDADETFSYSNTINIYVKGENFNNFIIYPNPVNENLIISLYSVNMTSATVKIY